MGWAAIRIDYHNPDKAALLHGAIGPMLASLDRDGVRRAMFRPHWRFGPHAIFALELDGEATAFPEAALAPIRDWITANPSTAVIDPIQYLASSQKRGKAEGVEGPYLPIAPNNSIVPAPASVASGEPGSLARITLDFHSAALPILVDVAGLKADSDRLWIRLAGMFACAAWLAGPARIAGGHLSFRSHAEGFLSGAPALRPRFEAFAARFVDEAADHIQTIEKALKEDRTGRALDPALDPALAPWFAVLLEVKAAIDAHVEGLSPEALEAHAPGTGDRKPGAFEKMVLNGALKQLRGNRQFIAYRLLLSMMYGLLPTIGVKPVERFALCHLVAESGTRIYRVDWRRHLSGGGSRGGWLLGTIARLTKWSGARAVAK